MRKWNGKRYWLVGASAGLGAAVAPKLSALGCEVILSARSEDGLKEVAEACSGPTQIVTVDIADDESVATAAEAVGPIDGLVFLAGVYWPQPAQAWNASEVTKMLDINLTGAVRVLGHVVPKMVEADDGHIVLTGSLSGFRGLPGAIGYGASKAGIMSLAESMYADLRGSGVDVQLELGALPVINGAFDTLAMGIVSSLQPANLRLRSALCNAPAVASDPRYPILFDPQTSGGLLASVPAANAQACLQALRTLGYLEASRIGWVMAQGEQLKPVTVLC